MCNDVDYIFNAEYDLKSAYERFTFTKEVSRADFDSRLRHLETSIEDGSLCCPEKPKIGNDFFKGFNIAIKVIPLRRRIAYGVQPLIYNKTIGDCFQF